MSEQVYILGRGPWHHKCLVPLQMGMGEFQQPKKIVSELVW